MLLCPLLNTLCPYTTLFRSIVPLWKPHWIFGAADVDIKMLEDPKEIYGGDGDQIYTVAREGLEEDAPAAYHILEQYDESYEMLEELMPLVQDRKSTRLNSSHVAISYAVFCLQKKTQRQKLAEVLV